MKKQILFTLISVSSLLAPNLAAAQTAQIGELTPGAAETVGQLLRMSEQSGQSPVQFKGDAQVTIYSVGNISCYFQNDDGTVSCSTDAELDDLASDTVGWLLRQAELSGATNIIFGGSAQITTYTIENLTCYFQNDDNSVSCSVETADPRVP